MHVLRWDSKLSTRMNSSVSTIYPTTAYKSVFEDKLRQLPGVAHFEVGLSVPPPSVISPVRKIAVHMKPKLKEALDTLTKKDVILTLTDQRTGLVISYALLREMVNSGFA